MLIPKAPFSKEKKIAREANGREDCSDLAKFLGESAKKQKLAPSQSFMDWSDETSSQVSPSETFDSAGEGSVARHATGGGGGGGSGGIGTANVGISESPSRGKLAQKPGEQSQDKQGKANAAHTGSAYDLVATRSALSLSDGPAQNSKVYKHGNKAISLSNIKQKLGRKFSATPVLTPSPQDLRSELSTPSIPSKPSQKALHSAESKSELSGSAPTIPDINIAPWDWQLPNGDFEAAAFKAVHPPPPIPDPPVETRNLRSFRSSDTIRTTTSIGTTAPSVVPSPKPRHKVVTENQNDSQMMYVSRVHRSPGFPTSPDDPNWDHAIELAKRQLAEFEAEEKRKIREAELEAKRDPVQEAKAKKAAQAKAGMALIRRGSQYGYAPIKPLYEMNREEIAMVGAALDVKEEKKGIRKLFRHVGQKQAKADILRHAYEQRQKQIQEELEAAKRGPATPCASTTRRVDARAHYEAALRSLEYNSPSEYKSPSEMTREPSSPEPTQIGDDKEATPDSQLAYAAKGKAAVGAKTHVSPVGLGIADKGQSRNPGTVGSDGTVVTRDFGATSRPTHHRNYQLIPSKPDEIVEGSASAISPGVSSPEVSSPLVSSPEVSSPAASSTEVADPPSGSSYKQDILLVARSSRHLEEAGRFVPRRNSSFMRKIHQLTEQRATRMQGIHPALRGNQEDIEDVTPLLGLSTSTSPAIWARSGKQFANLQQPDEGV